MLKCIVDGFSAFLDVKICCFVCVQMNKAVNLSFFLDSYNLGNSMGQNVNLFTESVSDRAWLSATKIFVTKVYS